MMFREPNRIWLAIAFVALALATLGFAFAERESRGGWAIVTSIGIAVVMFHISYEQLRWAQIGQPSAPSKFATGFKLSVVSLVLLSFAMRFMS